MKGHTKKNRNKHKNKNVSINSGENKLENNNNNPDIEQNNEDLGNNNDPNLNNPQDNQININNENNINIRNEPQHVQEINIAAQQDSDRDNNRNNSQNFIVFSRLYYVHDISAKEKFLFLFQLDYLANQFFCGCSLRFGVQIISLLFLVASISKLFNTFSQVHVLNILASGAVFTIFLITGFCLMYSSTYYDPHLAFYGYFIYALIFYYLIFQSLAMLVFITLGLYNPLGESDYMIKITIILVSILLIFCFHLYFVWICFSFWIHLKNKNLELIKGNFYRSYHDYTNLQNRRVEDNS